jgi:S-adenosylmethionine-diacylglycerol 3-amino-3-carboxypropyl transferase
MDRVRPYLEERNFELVRARAERIDLRHMSVTDFLAQSPDCSADCYVLLDAQDWMNDDQLGSLWRQITRTARPDARVIFRTAADERLLPGRVPASILNGWHYEQDRSRALHLRDRSSIYGAFHLYRKVGA